MLAFLFRFFCSKDTFNTSIETIIIDIPPISAKYRFELFLLNPVGGSILTLCELSASISIGVTTSTGLYTPYLSSFVPGSSWDDWVLTINYIFEY